MMYRLGLWIAKHRIAVLIFAVILLIPAVLGYLMLHVNYDILYYLPDDIETMQGQQILLDDFGKGAYAMFVAEDMPDSQVAALKAEIEQVDHVADVIWYDSVMDITVPAKILKRQALEHLNTGCFLFEAASAPHGIDFCAAEDLGFGVYKALSLPGKTAPKSAGCMIAETVRTLLPEVRA